jgi:hypothetical protein|tara:strand:+ start:712 stop:960 length:249 start_codon:yes stop_codon:yes gene_type:complete
MDKDEIIKQLQEENSLLKNELESTQNHLKKYTAPARNRNRYNPDKSKEYQSKITSEKKKEYARQAYLNKKEKLKKEQENENI